MTFICDMMHINAKANDRVKQNHLQLHLRNTERRLQRIVLLKCIRRRQSKRGHEGSEQEEETKVPKRTA